MKTTLLNNILTGFTLVFFLGTLNAQTTWTGATSSDFNEDTNWDTGLSPTGADDVFIPASATNPILSSETDEVTAGGQRGFISHFTIQAGGQLTVTDTLTVWSGSGGNYTGGTLTVEAGTLINFRNRVDFGITDNPAVVNFNGGRYNSKYWTMIANQANCVFNINGGEVNTEGAYDFTVGGYSAYGTVNVNGGVLAPGALAIDARGDRFGAGHVTVDGGTIILVNDQSALVTQWIADGKLKAVAGKEISVSITPAVAEDPFATPPVAAQPAYTNITAVALPGAKQVAYLTKTKTMATGASTVNDDAIIRMLQNDAYFDVTVITDPASNIDLSSYDLVIAQDTFDPSDAIFTGSLGIQNITVPTIFNKTYAWVGSNGNITDIDANIVESASLSITVADPVRQSDPLFSGIDFSGGNDIQIFNTLANDDGSAGGTKGLQILNAIDITQGASAIGGGTLHASTADVVDPAAAIVFNELRAGTQIGENSFDVLQAPVIVFSMNYGAIANGNGANLTPEALTIWRNAAYHLTGMMSPATLYSDSSLGVDDIANSASNVSTDVKAMGNRIYITNVKSSSEINIYSITGALVKSIKTKEDINFIFRSGLWIATVKTFEGQKSLKLLVNNN